MQVITTHFSADFDCLAAMVAVQKLYPEAYMVFSGSMERAPQEFVEAHRNCFQFSRIKDIDLDQVTRLIVVDTQDPDRIGVFKSLIGRKGVEVHVYDHHLDVANPIPADQSVVLRRGASATLLWEILREKKIELSPFESTLMVLGIYQDTHSLNSSSTCPEDFYAAGQLVSQGADLNAVADFVEAKLNSEQLSVMNDLIVNLEIRNFNGVDIALATATLDHYVGDLAVVVFRLMELENINVVFALVRLDYRVYLIGRSRTEEVNAAHVLRTFGGGGHANAAAASTRDLTLVEAKEKLIEVLEEKVEPPHRIKNIMHTPVMSVKAKDTVAQTEKLMTRFNLNTLPVLSGKNAVGLITRQIIEKALHHKLEREAVEHLMAREFSVTTPEAYFKTVVPVIIEEKQKVVPVVHEKDGRLLGIVSRGDLLRILHQDMAHYSTGSYGALLDRAEYRVKNVKSLMKERLPRDVMALLEKVAEMANQQGVSLYAVGGFVRDLLLRIDNLDIDLVVEGEGIPFAKKLGKALGGRVVSHEKFGTSVVMLPDGFKLDIATARTEYYKHPAALPTVEKSSIKSDLFRRDFTFNSLAVKLNGNGSFALLDFFNGQRDLKDKVVRVLHNLSFIEDPSRAFRAIRFEQRLKFSIGKQTEAFIKRAVKKRFVEQMSGQRLFNELVLILKEKDVLNCVRRMKDLGLLPFIHPNLSKKNGLFDVLGRIQEIFSLSKFVHLVKDPESWWVNFLGLFFHLDAKSCEEVACRLKLSQKLKRRLLDDLEACRSSLREMKSKDKKQPSDVYNILAGVSPEAVLLLMAISGSEHINQQVLLFFTQYDSSAQLELNGDDLVRMGIQPGPRFKTVFKALRDARINGLIHSRDEEVAMVKEEFLSSKSR